MIVEELFARLSYGELSNLSMANNGNGTIAAPSQAKIVRLANAGLDRLYGRFLLSQKEVIVEMVEGRTVYPLLRRYAESFVCAPPCEDPHYILDATDPFLEDVLKVVAVFDAVGLPLPLNNSEEPRSLYTPQFNTLQVPNPDDHTVISVLYQARHLELEHGVLGAFIYLPAVLYDALTAFIAGSIYSAMNGAENGAKAREYMSRYESICAEVAYHDLVNTSLITSNTKLEKRGFV